MDIKLFAKLYDEFYTLIDDNWKHIQKAFWDDTYEYFEDFDLVDDTVRLRSADRYCENNYAELPFSVFESQETLTKFLDETIAKNEEAARKKQEAEEARKRKLEEMKKTREYKKYMELKEKFKEI